jgi:hypothetical protein
VECGVQPCLRENTKCSNANHTDKTRRFKNSKYNRNIGVHGRTAHSGRKSQEYTDHHKNIRRLTEQPIETFNDTNFSQKEVRQIIEGFDPRKAPGSDGITNNILTLVFASIPKTVTSIYNECLKRGYFPKEWKLAKIIPIIKPGK